MILRRVIKVSAILIGIVGVTLLFTGGPYFYACYLEDNWRSNHPEIREDLEKYLHFYSVHVIDPKASMWGRDYVLAENEKMVQYLILWSQPLDVVYDDQNRIKVIFTSYE